MPSPIPHYSHRIACLRISLPFDRLPSQRPMMALSVEFPPYCDSHQMSILIEGGAWSPRQRPRSPGQELSPRPINRTLLPDVAIGRDTFATASHPIHAAIAVRSCGVRLMCSVCSLRRLRRQRHHHCVRTPLSIHLLAPLFFAL